MRGEGCVKLSNNLLHNCVCVCRRHTLMTVVMKAQLVEERGTTVHGHQPLLNLVSSPSLFIAEERNN